DQLLNVLLSFQILAQRQQIIDFLAEIFAQFSSSEQLALQSTLVVLYRDSLLRIAVGRYERYLPVHVDIPTRLAVYNANLVTLMAFHVAVPFLRLLPQGTNLHPAWSSLTRFWQSRLDIESWTSLRNCLIIRTQDPAGIVIEIRRTDNRTPEAQGGRLWDVSQS